MQKSERNELRKLLKKHYGQRRPSAIEILKVMKMYNMRASKKGGRATKKK